MPPRSIPKNEANVVPCTQAPQQVRMNAIPSPGMAFPRAINARRMFPQRARHVMLAADCAALAGKAPVSRLSRTARRGPPHVMQT